MPVAGKSVLAAEAVRDPEITLQVSICIHLNATLIILSSACLINIDLSNNVKSVLFKFFPDGIFWFRVGIIESKEKLLNRLKILCEKLDAQSVPSSVEHAQEILRR